MTMDQSLRARPVRSAASRSAPADGDVEIGLLSAHSLGLKPEGDDADDGSYISSDDDDLSRTQDFSASHALLSRISNGNTHLPDTSPVYVTIHR